MIPSFVVDQKFRSSTVVAMCQSIRESDDYSSLPILADALQDADCDNEELLSWLRSYTGNPIHGQRVVAQIMSKQTADAVEWLDRFADKLGPSEREVGHWDRDRMEWVGEGTALQEMNYDVLIMAADNFIATEDGRCGGDRYTQYGGQGWQDAMSSQSACAKFWNKYSLVTGKLPKNKAHGIFGCSC